MNTRILSPEIQQFIKDHERHDPFQLSLDSDRYPGWPMGEIAAQIQSRAKARHKWPEWIGAAGLYFPPPVSVEQSSSQLTAEFKANLIGGGTAADITGGAGIDAFYFSRRAELVTYVEKDANLAEIARHNFSALGAENIRVVNADAAEFAAKMEPVETIYADPSRRVQKKVFLLEDSEPNAVELAPQLLKKTSRFILKTSPLLDIDSAIKKLPDVAAVYVVSVKNECKEVLYEMKRGFVDDPEIHAVNIGPGHTETFNFKRSDEVGAEPAFGPPETFLYEPNSSIMKAGAFKSAALRYDLRKLHPNSHLYTSSNLIHDFPGRIFSIQAVTPYNKKFSAALRRLKEANVIARNFPLTADKIKKAAGLRDGGDKFLIFTTDISKGRIAIEATRLDEKQAL